MSATLALDLSATTTTTARRGAREGSESRRLRRAVAQLPEHSPERVDLMRVLADSLVDDGCAAAAARTRAVADALARDIATVRAGADALRPAQRTRIRAAAGVSSACPIKIVHGADAPRCVGEEGYYEFRNGGRCAYPGSARRAGYKVDYVESTLRVVVGAQWLAENVAK